MSNEEKSLAQFAFGIYCPENVDAPWNPDGEAEQLFKRMVDGVIKEWQQRNGEPIGWAIEYTDGNIGYTESIATANFYRAAGYIVHDRFAAPQLSLEPVSASCKIAGKCQMPIFPSVEEIAKAMFERHGDSWIDAIDFVKAVYLEKAEAVLALLKEKFGDQ